jgi:hypothetical protein
MHIAFKPAKSEAGNQLIRKADEAAQSAPNVTNAAF